MTNEEAIAIIRKEYLCVDRDCDIERSCGKCDLAMPSKEPILEAYKMAIKALEQKPCEDIAQERYKDLCEYFGNAKDILKSREDFKDWLGRVKWHIRKAEELYEKYEYKQEPKTGHWIYIGNKVINHSIKIVECDKCHNRTYGSGKYCPNCGTKMVEPQESEDEE